MLSQVASNKSLNSKVEFDQLILEHTHSKKLNEVHRDENFKKSFLDIARAYKESVPLAIISASIGISSKKYHHWERKLTCSSSLKDFCRISHPSQLTKHEVDTIKYYLTTFLPVYRAKNTVHAKMIRESDVYVSETTFYEYADLLGFKNRSKRKKVVKAGIKASRPFEILHMDVSRIHLDNREKCYFYAIKDNYSKAILSYAVFPECTAQHSLENLKSAIDTFGVNHLNTSLLVTDDGSENKGNCLAFIKGKTQIIHRIAQSHDLPQSNSCIESYFRTLKSYYLKKSDLTSYQSFLRVIDDYVLHYNSQRFRKDLNFCSPFESFLGVTDSISHIPDKIKHAPILRKEINRRFNCTKFCNS